MKRKKVPQVKEVPPVMEQTFEDCLVDDVEAFKKFYPAWLLAVSEAGPECEDAYDRQLIDFLDSRRLTLEYHRGGKVLLCRIETLAIFQFPKN